MRDDGYFWDEEDDFFTNDDDGPMMDEREEAVFKALFPDDDGDHDIPDWEDAFPPIGEEDLPRITDFDAADGFLWRDRTEEEAQKNERFKRSVLNLFMGSLTDRTVFRQADVLQQIHLVELYKAFVKQAAKDCPEGLYDMATMVSDIYDRLFGDCPF